MSTYHPLPTVRVVNPNAPRSFMIINASDLSDDHEPWSDERDESDELVGSDLRVGKGPRGKWYLWLGRERAEGPFDTEAEAQSVLSARNGG